MSDNDKRVPPGMEGDPNEAQALKDLLDSGSPKTAGSVDSSVFEQDLFGAPPPAKPAAPQQPGPPPKPQAPRPAAPPPPPPPPQPPAAEEEDVKIVSPDDFEQLGMPQADAPQALSVEGTSAKDMTEDEWGDDGDYPEIAATPVEEVAAVEVPEAAPAASNTDEWELASPVDESAPIDEAIGAATQAAEDIPLTPDGTPVTLKAAKAKEGAQAIEQAREVIEKLDGLEEGFLDVAEVKKGMRVLAELANRVEELAARIEAIEARLK